MTMIDSAVPGAVQDSIPPLYRLAGVTRTYRQKGRVVNALTGVDLGIMTGDFVTIQGPTDGGKSTCSSCSAPSTAPRRARSSWERRTLRSRPTRSSGDCAPRRSGSSSRGST